jgi:hypothetical protein
LHRVGNGLDALVLIFEGYVQLGKLQKGDEVTVLQIPTSPVFHQLQKGLVPVSLLNQS